MNFGQVPRLEVVTLSRGSFCPHSLLSAGADFISDQFASDTSRVVVSRLDLQLDAADDSLPIGTCFDPAGKASRDQILLQHDQLAIALDAANQLLRLVRHDARAHEPTGLRPTGAGAGVTADQDGLAGLVERPAVGRPPRLESFVSLRLLTVHGHVLRGTASLRSPMPPNR
jgi:hypothetical protein